MNWSNIEKWRKLLKIGTIVLLSMLKYCSETVHCDRDDVVNYRIFNN
jgi:hypothetical protein